MKLTKKLALGVVAITAVSIFSTSHAFAKDNIFGGVQVDDSYLTTPPQTLPMNEIQAPSTNTPGVDYPLNYKKEDQKLHEALMNINNAQADIRSELNSVQAKYAETDKNYKSVKAERKKMKKQLKFIKKKLKSLESAKKKIQKNMNK